MTNVPNIFELLAVLLIVAAIPFITAYIPTRILYKKTLYSIAAGIIGVLLLILIAILPLGINLLTKAIIAGGLGSILLIAVLSLTKLAELPEMSTLKHDRKTIIAIGLIALVLLSGTLYISVEKKELEFSIADPRNDIGYSGYDHFKLSGHDDLDIVSLRSNVVDDNLLIDMEVAGSISQNDSAEYRINIAIFNYWRYNYYINEEEMTPLSDNTLRATVPLEDLEDRKLFHVTAINTEYDPSKDLGLTDTCSNKGWFWDMLAFLTS